MIFEVVAHQRGCGFIELAFWNSSAFLLVCLEDLSGLSSQDLAQLDTPLVKAVDVEEESLSDHSVLVDGQKLAAVEGVQRSIEENRETWSVTLEQLVLV